MNFIVGVDNGIVFGKKLLYTVFVCCAMLLLFIGLPSDLLCSMREHGATDQQGWGRFIYGFIMDGRGHGYHRIVHGYTRNRELVCTHCGRVFINNPKPATNYFCSKLCYNIWRHGDHNSNWRGGPARYECVKCGKVFYIPRERLTSQDGKYCSVECYHRHCDETRVPAEQFRLARQAAVYLRGAIHGKPIPKQWQIAFGYDRVVFMSHLQSLFKTGMSLENYGQWHIDHKTPKFTFRYTSTMDDGFKSCWSLSNLQPLWAMENMKKGRSV